MHFISVTKIFVRNNSKKSKKKYLAYVWPVVVFTQKVNTELFSIYAKSKKNTYLGIVGKYIYPALHTNTEVFAQWVNAQQNT